MEGDLLLLLLQQLSKRRGKSLRIVAMPPGSSGSGDWSAEFMKINLSYLSYGIPDG